MPLDPLSPLAPARIRVLVLPIGRLLRTRFGHFGRLLGTAAVVPLADLSVNRTVDGRPLSPLHFSAGHVLLDFVASDPAESQSQLAPFELFRRALVVIGLVDGNEYPDPGIGVDELAAATDDLTSRFPDAVLHQIVAFDTRASAIPDDVRASWICVDPTVDRPPDDQPADDDDQTSNDIDTEAVKNAVVNLTPRILTGLASLAQKCETATSITSISPSFFASLTSRPAGPAPNSTAEPGLTVPTTNPHRLSMPIIVPPVADRFGSRPPESKMTSDRPFSIVGLPTLFRPKTPSSIRPARSVSAREKTEMERIRLAIVAGSIQLMSGNWPAALRDLSDAAVRAKEIGDGLWYAKALENTIVALFLLVWAQIDFDLPKAVAQLVPPPARPVSSSADGPVSLATSDQSRQEGIRMLTATIPAVVRLVVNGYAHAVSAGQLPPVAFSEASVRLCKLSAVLYRFDGQVSRSAAAVLVESSYGVALPDCPVRSSTVPSRVEIGTVVMNSISPNLSPVDYVVVLAGVASVLSILRLGRKRAFVLHELVGSLVPSLIQARKLGAAELGLHPAVGLAALGTADRPNASASPLYVSGQDGENRIGHFLAWVNSAYGLARIGDITATHAAFTDDASCAEKPVMAADFGADAVLASFGGLGLKRDVLRNCIGVCDALPDFQAAIDFSSVFLRTLNPRFAPSIDPSLVAARMARDEQTRLWASMLRTIESARNLGLTEIATEYWDPFVVRNVRLLSGPDHLALTDGDGHDRGRQYRRHRFSSHSRSAGRSRSAGHDQPDTGTDRLFVVGEEREFVITLQNPFDIDVEIESVKLATRGALFECQSRSGVLKRRSTEDWIVAGAACASGDVVVIGCFLKIRTCRGRIFPIFPHAWHGHRIEKIKKMGLSAIPSRDGDLAGAHPGPTALTIPLTAIDSLPVLAVTHISAPQSAVMILEGQQASFSITVRNMSGSVPAVVAAVSFSDSVRTAIEAELAAADLPMSDAFELEHQLTTRPSIRLAGTADRSEMAIEPGRERTFEFDVLGKAGLTSISVKFSYAGAATHEQPDGGKETAHYLRHVSVPISVTVNSSVAVQKIDILPLGRLSPWNGGSGESFFVPTMPGFVAGPGFDGWKGKEGDQCVVVIDVRNTWPVPLSVSVHLHDRDPSKVRDLNGGTGGDEGEIVYSVVRPIQPGHLVRIPFVVPRFYLGYQHAPIRHLIGADEEQFTVNRMSLSADIERNIRQLFWYRHALLSLVSAEWTESGGVGSDCRHGKVDLRPLRLGSSMVKALALNGIDISIRITSGDGAELESGPVDGHIVPVDEHAIVAVTVHNRTSGPIGGILRLQPRLGGVAPPAAYELDKRLVLMGVLDQELEPIPGGDKVELEIGMIVLAAGEFEIGASFDKISLEPDCKPDQDAAGRGGRLDEAGRAADLDRLLTLAEETKRCWTVDRPIRLVAVDEDELVIS